jgi:hypothetical protein
MTTSNVMGLMAGILSGLLSLSVARSAAGNPGPAPLPVVERSLTDLQAFHTPEFEALWAAPEDAHPLEPFFEDGPDELCDDGEASYEAVVRDVAERLDARNIPYRRGGLTDCSGMMHRVLRTVAGRCGNVVRPSLKRARRAKDLARWYDRQGRLTRVDSPEDIDAALTVGSVVFFLAPGARSGGLDRVHHIGMVTDIQRDNAGRIQSYAMFHGRRPGFSAGITRWHGRDRTPSLGNGAERMVAVAWPSDEVLPEQWLDFGDEVVAETAGRVLGGAL